MQDEHSAVNPIADLSMGRRSWLGVLPQAAFSAGSVVRLGAVDQARVVAWLSRQPTRHAWLLGWIACRGMVPSAPGDSFVFYCGEAADGRAIALVAGDALVSLGGDSEEAAARIGAHLRVSGFEASLVLGPADLVGGFQKAVEHPGRSPRLWQNQTLQVLKPRKLRHFGPVPLRQADPIDVPDLLAAALAMHVEETGEPLAVDVQGSLHALVWEQVNEGRTWCVVDPVTGDLQFKANIAMPTPLGAHLEGVWVPPAYRRRGVARSALSELCRRLLTVWPTVSLYTNVDNEAACALYRRIGFREEARWCTVHGPRVTAHDPVLSML